MPERIAVIVVNYNGGEDVLRCLAGVKAQTCVPRRIIVVDNDSQDDSAAKIETRFADVELVRNTANLGFAVANNQGIAMAADCDWVALLNPDAFPDPDWLAELLAASRAHPQVGVLASKLVDANDPTRLDGTGDLYHVSGLSWRRDHGAALSMGEGRSPDIFSPCAAAAMYRRELIERVGGFDEAYFCYHEDVDLVFRMRLEGASCRYVPASVALHVGSGVTGRDSDFSVYHGHRNLVWTYFRNMPGWMFWVYLPQHLLMNLVVIIMYAARGKAGLILKSKWHALRELPRVLRLRRTTQAGRTESPGNLRRTMETGLLKPYLSRHA